MSGRIEYTSEPGKGSICPHVPFEAQPEAVTHGLGVLPTQRIAGGYAADFGCRRQSGQQEVMRRILQRLGMRTAFASDGAATGIVRATSISS